MANDQIQVLISGIVDPQSIAQIRKQLEDVGKNIAVNPKTRISAQMFKGSEKDIELFKRNMTSAIGSLKIGKDKIFGRADVAAQLKELTSDISNFGTVGGKSTKEIRTQFGELRTHVNRVAESMHSVQKQGYAMTDMLIVAARKMLAWKIIGDLIFGTVRQIKDGIQAVVI